MPVADSSIDDLWTGRPFAEIANPPPPPPSASARSSTSAEVEEAAEDQNAEQDGEEVVGTDPDPSTAEDASLQTILDELRLLRDDRARSFRAALAIACLAFAVIAGYMDRLLRELRRRSLS